MKVYLDDVRKAPWGWTRVFTAGDCIALLEKGIVEELSLDHDLEPEHYADEPGYNAAPVYASRTGYAVVAWMIENSIWPRVVIVHSMNPVGRKNMLDSLRRYAPDGVVIEERIGWRG